MIEAMLSQMNNRALNLLCRGELEDAQALLSKLILTAAHYIGSGATSDHRKFPQLEFGAIALSEVLGREDNACHLEAILAGQGFSLYRHAFAVDDGACSDVVTMTILAAYNLAVIQHEIAMEDSSCAHLTLAGSFYKLAVSHLQQGRHNCPVLVELALYNNVGHLYSVMGNFEGILECQILVEKSLVPLSSGGARDLADLSFFQKSVQQSRKTAITLAPAA